MTVEQPVYRVTVMGYMPDNDVARKRHEYHLARGQKLVTTKFTYQRNLAFHRKAFALVNVIFDSSEGWETIEQLRKALTIRSGYVDKVIINPQTGETHIIPKSWAFNKMEQEEFEQLFNDMKTVALEMLPQGWDSALIETAVMEIVGF